MDIFWILFAITAVFMAYYHGREAGREEIIEKTEEYIMKINKIVKNMAKNAKGIHDQYNHIIDEALKEVKKNKVKDNSNNE